MKSSPIGAIVKLGIFGIAMVVLTAFLFMVFSQYQTGSSNKYSAVFGDVSRLKAGDSVRVAGIRVGTVDDITLRPDKTVSVRFDAARRVVLTTGSTAAVRYLNLVGDRYLELMDGPGSTHLLPPGSQIPLERTKPALDLDLLLGGLKPVVQGLNPNDVNQLTSSLLQIFQGQEDTLDSLFSRTSSFTNALADKGEVMQQVIDHLRTVLTTISQGGQQFSSSIDQLDRLVTGLSADRASIGTAIDSLAQGTASLAGLLTETRPPLAGTINQLNRLAPMLDQDKGRLETALQKSPENYRKLIRIGSYGSFVNFYICGMSLRVSDMQLRTAVFPWFKNQGGRCADNG